MRGAIILMLISISLRAHISLQTADDEAGSITYAKSITKNDTSYTINKTPYPLLFDKHIPIQAQQVDSSSLQDSISASDTLIYLQSGVLALEEVVVTGLHSSQSMKNAVYKIRTINREKIQGIGANNLQDILNNELNFRFSRDNALGTSGLSIQGISGQNVKVLLDGIPMVGRSGIANEIDLQQINVNNIDRIEIVEGAMAVSFGADALAGVINIITKKGNDDKFSAEIISQEESVGKNYSLFDEGIHNLGITINSNLSKHLFVQADGRVNTFGGWVGDEKVFSDRDRQWYPKSQQMAGGMMRYATEDLSVYYKADFLDETIQNLGKVNALDPHLEPYGEDLEYLTQRWVHQLQGDLQAGAWVLNPSLTYSDFSRETQAYRTYLSSELEDSRKSLQNVYQKTIFSRTTASYQSNRWGTFQLGSEVNFDRMGGSTLSEGEKEALDIALFISSEIRFGKKWAARPGIRYGYNSLYKSSPSPALNLKYSPNENASVRVGYGRGFRVPSVRELYHEFIDFNHNIIGNPGLRPEYSNSFNADASHSWVKAQLETSLSFFYNAINDQITFFTPNQSNAATTYLNLEKFKSKGAVVSTKWTVGDFKIASGVTYLGRFQRLTSDVDNVPKFTFNWEANSNLTYQLRKTKTTFNVFYKLNGALKDYRLVDTGADGNFSAELQRIGAFHLMDVTISQVLLNSLNLSIGARNLLNVTTVNNSGAAGTHGSGSGSASVGYGTSYFLRIHYHFKI